MTLQQDLLKSKWQGCEYCEGLGILERIQGSERKCIDCQGTGIQPQIFDNECDLSINTRIVWKHKSGDVLKYCSVHGLVVFKLPSCQCEDFIKFKILRTLENGKKIEVVRI